MAAVARPGPCDSHCSSCATVAARQAERALSARNLGPACAPGPPLAARAWPRARGRATVAPRHWQATGANATVATAGTGGWGAWSRPLAGRQPPRDPALEGGLASAGVGISCRGSGNSAGHRPVQAPQRDRSFDVCSALARTPQHGAPAPWPHETRVANCSPIQVILCQARGRPDAANADAFAQSVHIHHFAALV
jgi:hypothetical protein